MIIIDTKEKHNEFVKFVKEHNKKKVISRFCFGGETYHDGHLFLIDEIKKQSDILIADYIGHTEYLQSVFKKKLGICNDINIFNDNEKLNDKYNKIINNFSKLNNIDYLIISKHTFFEKNFNIIKKLENDFKNIVIKAKKLNISYELLIYSLCIFLESPLEKITHMSGGIKNLCVLPIIKNLFPTFFYKREQNINKIIIYKLIKNNIGHVLSRQRYNKILSDVVVEAIKEINQGKTTLFHFKTILKDSKYYLKNPMVTLLDFNSGEMISEINNNCALIFMSGETFESIYFLDGKFIY